MSPTVPVSARRVPGPAAGPRGRSGPGIAAGLFLLSAIPVTAGVLRLAQLSGLGEPIPADARFGTFPVALVLHIVGSAVFAIAGAVQFLPRFRRRHLTWHRRAGRVLVATGLVVTTSALWLTVLYDPKEGTGPLLYGFRLAVAILMTGCILLGFGAVRRSDICGHRAWMIRAYALGLGAGTQIFTEGFGEALFGSGVLAGDLQKGAGWVINLLVAEVIIRRRGGRR